MCLKPRLIINRHYLKIANNNNSGALSLFGNAPDFYVKVDCGLCVECQKKRGNMWKTRLLDEYKYFIERFPRDRVCFGTLTISPEHYSKFSTSRQISYEVRKFLERYRRKYGCSFRHYITTEFGEKKGRLHFHFIGFRMLCNIQELRELWSYGRVDMQTLKGPQGLTYVSGYITKITKADKQSHSIPFFIDNDHKTQVFVSPGFGKSYTLDPTNRNYHIQRNKPIYIRQHENGLPFGIPRYYMDKLFSPIDLLRRKDEYFNQSLQLPKPPFRAHKRQFNDFVSYINYVRSIGGAPLSLISNNQLPTDVANALIYLPEYKPKPHYSVESFPWNAEVINSYLYG